MIIDDKNLFKQVVTTCATLSQQVSHLWKDVMVSSQYAPYHRDWKKSPPYPSQPV